MIFAKSGDLPPPLFQLSRIRAFSAIFAANRIYLRYDFENIVNFDGSLDTHKVHDDGMISHARKDL